MRNINRYSFRFSMSSYVLINHSAPAVVPTLSPMQRAAGAIVFRNKFPTNYAEQGLLSLEISQYAPSLPLSLKALVVKSSIYPRVEVVLGASVYLLLALSDAHVPGFRRIAAFFFSHLE